MIARQFRRHHLHTHPLAVHSQGALLATDDPGDAVRRRGGADVKGESHVGAAGQDAGESDGVGEIAGECGGGAGRGGEGGGGEAGACCGGEGAEFAEKVDKGVEGVGGGDGDEVGA